MVVGMESECRYSELAGRGGNERTWDKWCVGISAAAAEYARRRGGAMVLLDARLPASDAGAGMDWEPYVRRTGAELRSKRRGKDSLIRKAVEGSETVRCLRPGGGWGDTEEARPAKSAALEEVDDCRCRGDGA